MKSYFYAIQNYFLIVWKQNETITLGERGGGWRRDSALRLRNNILLLVLSANDSVRNHFSLWLDHLNVIHQVLRQRQLRVFIFCNLKKEPNLALLQHDWFIRSDAHVVIKHYAFALP